MTRAMNAIAIQNKPVIKAKMSVMLLYEEFDLATKARGMLTRAMKCADETKWWEVRPWRVDMLAPAGMAARSLAEARNAHLIVLAVRNQADLPPGLLDWLENWAGLRQVTDAALAVLDGGDGFTPSPGAAPELEHLAECHGLSIIFCTADPNQDESQGFSCSLHGREVTAASTPQYTMAGSIQDNYRGWWE